MAPKRAAQKKDDNKGSKRRKEKPVGMELTFPREDPGVPEMLETIGRLHNLFIESNEQKNQRNKTVRASV